MKIFKLILAVVLLCVCALGWGQLPKKNLLAYYHGKIRWADTVMLDSVGSNHIELNGIDYDSSFSNEGFIIKSDFSFKIPMVLRSYYHGVDSIFAYDTLLRPVSLSRNINFSNKIFCRYKNQTLNVDTTEKQPFRIVSLALYSDALTGASLDSAKAFFQYTDTAKTGNKFVNGLTGNDANAGTWLAPYKTIDKAIQTCANNDSIFVMSGVYKEATSGYTHLRFARANINPYVLGLGNVTVMSTGADVLTFETATATTIFYHRNLIYDGRDTSQQIIKGSAVDNNFLLCRFIRPKSNSANIIQDFSSSIMTLVKCQNPSGIIRSMAFNHVCEENYESNLTVATFQIGVTKIKYCKFGKTSSIKLLIDGTTASNNGIEVLYNYFDLNNTALDLYRFGNNSPTYIVRKNKFVVKDRTQGTSNGINIRLATTLGTNNTRPNIIIKNNIIIDTVKNNINGIDYIPIFGSAITKFNVENNYILSYNYNQCFGIKYAGADTLTSATIKNNYMSMRTLIGIPCCTGEAGDALFKNVEIAYNYVNGYADDTALVSTTHGFLMRGLNLNIHGNWSEYCNLGYVLKSGGIISNNRMYNNIAYNNQSAAFYGRQLKSAIISNNTFMHDSVGSYFMIIDNQGNGTEDVWFYNNLFYQRKKASVNTTQIVIDSNLKTEVKFFNTVFALPDSSKLLYYTEGVYKTWSQMQTLGILNNSKYILPANFRIEDYANRKLYYDTTYIQGLPKEQETLKTNNVWWTYPINIETENHESINELGAFSFNPNVYLKQTNLLNNNGIYLKTK